MKKEFVASVRSGEPRCSGFFQPPSAWHAPSGPGERVLGGHRPPQTAWTGSGAPWVRVCMCRGVPSPISAEGSWSWWSCCPRGPVQSLQGGEASLTLEGLPGILGWWESSFLQEGNERRPRACLARLELGCRPLHSSDSVAGLCPVCERGPSWVPEGPAHPARQDLPAPSSARGSLPLGLLGPSPSLLWGSHPSRTTLGPPWARRLPPGHGSLPVH